MTMTFSRQVFEFLKTVVPFWRISDEARLLSDGTYLVGIGVERNYGGQILVLPISQGDPIERVQPVVLPYTLNGRLDTGPCLVVLENSNGRYYEELSALVRPVKVLLWSERHELQKYVLQNDA